MKQKTHSGAKKRLRRTGGKLVKRKRSNRRHLLENKSAKRMRNLRGTAYVHTANAYQVDRLLADR